MTWIRRLFSFFLFLVDETGYFALGRLHPFHRPALGCIVPMTPAAPNLSLRQQCAHLTPTAALILLQQDRALVARLQQRRRGRAGAPGSGAQLARRSRRPEEGGRMRATRLSLPGCRCPFGHRCTWGSRAASLLPCAHESPSPSALPRAPAAVAAPNPSLREPRACAHLPPPRQTSLPWLPARARPPPGAAPNPPFPWLSRARLRQVKSLLIVIFLQILYNSPVVCRLVLI